MDIQTSLKSFKLISATQVDLTYFNSIAPQVFSDSKPYSVIQSDVQFINQIGATLFNYFNQQSPESQRIWFQALKTGLETTLSDIEAFIPLIPTDKAAREDLIAVLTVLKADCQAILAIIPADNGSKK